jgi:UDP-N-acetyl-D-mannosaminuronate dehydrogenase
LKILIIGQGYVGLTISAFAGERHQVVGFDKNAAVVERLNQGISHIEGVDSALLKAEKIDKKTGKKMAASSTAPAKEKKITWAEYKAKCQV